MSIRKKIILVLIPVSFAVIAITYHVFTVFFRSYLKEQETAQIQSVCDNVQSYVSRSNADYLGTANDWGHWGDTYYFLSGDNPEYVGLNLTKGSFQDLDINFMVFLNLDGSVYYSQYFDSASGEFTEFDTGLLSAIQQTGQDSGEAEYSAVVELAGDYCFFAVVNISDSLCSLSSNGRMIIGRMIDETIIADLNELSGGTLVSMRVANEAEPDGGAGPGISRDERSLRFNCMASSESGSQRLMLTFEKNRDLFLSGMKELNGFMLISLALSCVLAAILFTLLGVFFSKPFMRLIKEVKRIDHQSVTSITVSGGGEFTYLGKAINGMLREIREEQRKVKESEEKLYATLLSVGDGVIVVGRDGLVQFLNPVAQKLTGWKQGEAMGRPFEEVFRIINEFTREKVESPVGKVFETESIIELANHTLLIAKDDTEKPIEDTAAPVRDREGCVVACVLVFRDSSEKKEKQRRIEYMSYHDQLTGLYNRRFFEDETKRLDNAENLPISLVYADVNNLKVVNDAFGHSAGDALIQRAAEVLEEVCKDGVIARTGGDEFILLLKRTDAQTAAAFVDDINDRLKKYQIMGIDISLSFGMGTKNTVDQPIWDIMKSAEDSMYRSKIRTGAEMRTVVVDSILAELRAKYPAEGKHLKNVGRLCKQIASAMQLSKEETKALKMAGELHDIGMIAVDASVLNKSGPLAESEWAQIKGHPETGYRILSTSSEYYSIAEYVLAHHERWDGHGYPKGLFGESINRNSRIIAIADAYDEMTNERPYRLPMSPRQAAEEIMCNAGSQFDPYIAEVFVRQVLNIECEPREQA